MKFKICCLQKSDGFAPNLGCSSYLRIIFRVVLVMNDIQFQYGFSTKVVNQINFVAYGVRPDCRYIETSLTVEKIVIS